MWVVLEATLLSELFLCSLPSYDDHSHLITLIRRALYNPLKHTASFVFQDEFLHRLVVSCRLSFSEDQQYQLDILKVIFLNIFRKPVNFVVLAQKCPFFVTEFI